MLKINLHSYYDNFTLHQIPKYIEWVKDGTGAFDMYSDDYIRECQGNKNDCALMIEPRGIPTMFGVPFDRFEYIKQNYKKFKYIFTHDSELLKLPNAKQIYWGGVYERNNVPKTKDISFCCSDKSFTEMHRRRNELARQLKDTVDVMGTLDGGQRVSTFSIYAEYRYSIVIENHRDDYWFTEKICNCFANRTIPIYYGAKKIYEIFEPGGIVYATSIDSIPRLASLLKGEYGKKWYDSARPYVELNYEIVHNYMCFEDTFYKMHEELLNKLAKK